MNSTELFSPGFKQKVAIVTGAGQGIGHEIARQLASQGASVALNDLDADLALASALRISSEEGVCVAFPGDASDPVFIQKLVRQVVQQFGSVDIAVANAAISFFSNFFEVQPEDLRKVIGLNLEGAFWLAQAAAWQMKAQGRGGRLLFLSSVTGVQAYHHLELYGVTKAALQMLAKSLVPELAPLGITTNALCPGATLTERTLEDAAYHQQWIGITPTGRAGTVEDMAAAALFLLSAQAQHITGQTLVVDGGWTSVSPLPPES